MEKIINLPCKVLIGDKARERANELLESLKLGKKCTVFSSTTINEFVRDEIVSKFSFDAEIIEPSSNNKDYIEELAKKINSDFIIGIGGGRIIDIAKYCAFIKKKPWVAFPTIPSHDGVVSSRASIEYQGMKISFTAEEPIAIIADLEIIKKSPYKMVAAGVGDILANISSVEDWRIAHSAGKEEYNALIAELGLIPAKAVLQHIDDIKNMDSHGLEILMWSLICSGFAMNIYGSSRPCSGSEHNFSHALDSLGCKAMHGEKVALGTLIMTYLQYKDWKGIKELLKKFDLPVNARSLGVDEETMVKALVLSKGIRDRYTVLNEHNIDMKKAMEILRELDIIS